MQRFLNSLDIYRYLNDLISEVGANNHLFFEINLLKVKQKKYLNNLSHILYRMSTGKRSRSHESDV